MSKSYPDEIRKMEEEAILSSRSCKNVKAEKSCVGIALSGGGVRSATQSLGAFQGLQDNDLTKEIDYLSTVSGGGYFGTFWCRSHIEGDTDLNMESGKVKYLRNAGNYISPSGKTELLKSLSVVFLNSLSLLAMNVLYLLMFFMCLRYFPKMSQSIDLSIFSVSSYICVSVVGLLLIGALSIVNFFYNKISTKFTYFAFRIFIFGLVIAVIDSVGLNIYKQLSLLEIGYLSSFASALLYAFNLGKKIFKKPSMFVKFVKALIVVVLFLCITGITSAISHYVFWDLSSFSDYTVGYDNFNSFAIPSFILLSLVALNVAIGFKKGLLNKLSLHHIFYSKLVRSFMGAAVPDRINGGIMYGQGHHKDDILEKNYRPYHFGGPVHIFNITVNETVDGRSKLHQINRKGSNLAIIPTIGKSLGVRHHAIFGFHREKKGVWNYPIKIDGKKYHAWGYKEFKPEELSIGECMAISASSISTGMGKNSNILSSLINGILGIRMGYWWSTNIAGKEKRNYVFNNQSLFGSELRAKFFGTSTSDWYLSDGGHFENCGLYELIRRKLKFMILFDHGMDPNYSFDDVAEFIRTVRADFSAEVRWLNDRELDLKVHKDLRHLFGQKKHIGKRYGEYDGIEFDGSVFSQGAGEYSKAYAGLLEVKYRDGSIGHILCIKPTLMGGEPIDVLSYYSDNPEFPQQTTNDQFFDEEQWESYRKLMNHIVSELFSHNGNKTPSEWMRKGFVE